MKTKISHFIKLYSSLEEVLHLMVLELVGGNGNGCGAVEQVRARMTNILVLTSEVLEG
jgi:hypothetical protein